MADTHALLAVERAMTEDEKVAMLRRWYEINPHQRGAAVADILDQLASSDSHLDVIEPLLGEHASEYRGRPLDLAVLAVIYAYGETVPGTCLRCRGAGRVEGNIARPVQDPCGRCGGSGEAEVPTARWELVEALMRRVKIPGDVVRLAGAAARPAPVDDLAVETFPVHAFSVEGVLVAELSLCGRLAFSDTDADAGDLVGYELAQLDRRCAWCDSRVSNFRASGVTVTSQLNRVPRSAVFYASHVGDPVIFRYYHGEEQHGIVSSVNARNVFVRFLGPDGAYRQQAEACAPDRLRLADEPWRGD